MSWLHVVSAPGRQHTESVYPAPDRTATAPAQQIRAVHTALSVTVQSEDCTAEKIVPKEQLGRRQLQQLRLAAS